MEFIPYKDIEVELQSVFTQNVILQRWRPDCQWHVTVESVDERFVESKHFYFYTTNSRWLTNIPNLGIGFGLTPEQERLFATMDIFDSFNRDMSASGIFYYCDFGSRVMDAAAAIVAVLKNIYRPSVRPKFKNICLFGIREFDTMCVDGFRFEFPDIFNLADLMSRIDRFNCDASKYGFEKIMFEEETKTLTWGNYCVDGISRLNVNWKNKKIQSEINALAALSYRKFNCPTLRLLNGNDIKGFVKEDPFNPEPVDSIKEGDLFMENIRLFLRNSEKILNDSRLFFTPVYSQTFSPHFKHRPTLGVFIEWWRQCEENMVERDGLPICYISGSPMTGGYACSAVNKDGNIVKAHINVGFTTLLKSLGKIINRYENASDIYQSYSLKEALSILQHRC